MSCASPHRFRSQVGLLVALQALLLTNNVTLIAVNGLAGLHFTVALFALGVGWNFMYTGATALLTHTYRPAEKNKVQGLMDSIVFATMITSSASSGALLFVDGWSVLNLLSLPFVVAALAAVLWLAARSGWAFGRAGIGAAS